MTLQQNSTPGVTHLLGALIGSRGSGMVSGEKKHSCGKIWRGAGGTGEATKKTKTLIMIKDPLHPSTNQWQDCEPQEAISENNGQLHRRFHRTAVVVFMFFFSSIFFFSSALNTRREVTADTQWLWEQQLCSKVTNARLSTVQWWFCGREEEFLCQTEYRHSL